MPLTSSPPCTGLNSPQRSLGASLSPATPMRSSNSLPGAGGPYPPPTRPLGFAALTAANLLARVSQPRTSGDGGHAPPLLNSIPTLARHTNDAILPVPTPITTQLYPKRSTELAPGLIAPPMPPSIRAQTAKLAVTLEAPRPATLMTYSPSPPSGVMEKYYMQTNDGQGHALYNLVSPASTRQPSAVNSSSGGSIPTTAVHSSGGSRPTTAVLSVGGGRPTTAVHSSIGSRPTTAASKPPLPRGTSKVCRSGCKSKANNGCKGMG